MEGTSEMRFFKFSDNLINSASFYDEEGQLKFQPPVYEQRYEAVIRILEDDAWEYKIQKVAEFGCSEMRFLQLLRRVDGIQHILQVDIDNKTLQDNKYRAQPLMSDHLQKRTTPLRIEILQGSIDAAVEKLKDVDAVVGIEVIEHVLPDVLGKIPENIFGFMQPKLAIFTTPNSEYNILFDGLLPNGFRHYDHKFEWTRQEFEKWACDICKRYPNYKVNFMGVGKPPKEDMNIGFVSQIAIFARLDMLGEDLVTPIREAVPVSTNEDEQYKEIYSVDFPFTKDLRTRKQKIRDEALYEINSNMINAHLVDDNYEIPVSVILRCIENCSLECTEEELREILLENNFKVQDDLIIVSIYPDSSDDELCESVIDEKPESSSALGEGDNISESWD